MHRPEVLAGPRSRAQKQARTAGSPFPIKVGSSRPGIPAATAARPDGCNSQPQDPQSQASERPGSSRPKTCEAKQDTRPQSWGSLPELAGRIHQTTDARASSLHRPRQDP